MKLQKLISLIIFTLLFFMLCESSSDDVYNNDKCDDGKMSVILNNPTSHSITILTAVSGGTDVFEAMGVPVGPEGWQITADTTLGPFSVDAGSFEVSWKNCGIAEVCPDDEHSATKNLCSGSTYTVAFIDTDPYYEITEKE